MSEMSIVASSGTSHNPATTRYRASASHSRQVAGEVTSSFFFGTFQKYA